MTIKGVTPDGFFYWQNILNDDEETNTLNKIMALEYQQASFRGHLLKRVTIGFGFAYSLDSRQLTVTEEIPPYLLSIAEKALPYCIPGTEFNSCIITCYPISAGINWHIDNRKFDETILGFSLGGISRFQLRPTNSPRASCEVQLGLGSMYIMSGSSRVDFEHRLMPVKTERYSIIFRYVPINP